MILKMEIDSKYFSYCKRGNFRVGVIFAFFALLVFFAKFTPTWKLNPYAFMKEIGVISWKLPPREMSCQHFREIFPQRKLPRLQYIVIPGFQSRWYNIQYKTYAYQFMELGLAHGKLANVLHGLHHCYEVTQCNSIDVHHWDRDFIQNS